MGTVRVKQRVRDILPSIKNCKYTIGQAASLSQAISHLIREKLASSLVVNEEGDVCGIFTARDILRCINKHDVKAGGHGGGQHPQHRSREHISREHMEDVTVADIMTAKEQLVYCSPNDTTRRCREIMFQCKIRNLPVIQSGEVKGIVTSKLLADASFNLIETGGKKGFIHNVTGRRGLQGIKTDSAVPRLDAEQHLLEQSTQLDMDVGGFALPHPFKRAEGVAASRRDYGACDLSSDMSLCEDSHFVLKIPAAGDSASSSSQVYLCVADGVGSWRQYGVDPRAYSHKLVENARKVIESDVEHRRLIGHSPFDRDLDPVHPLDVIMDAWNLSSSEGVVGSSTICVATLDTKLNQLSYSNLGDGGLIVIRHIDSETAGYMRERQLPRHLRNTDLRIAYLSQQQLRSFNLPYQLGYNDPDAPPGQPCSFESPADADTASIPVMPNDIIVMATDGLFDNLDLDDIVAEVDRWEKGLSNKDTGKLAEQLVLKARELSLDKHRDSPFAILAKENDILWSGGMPDDTTVVIARVTTAKAS
ncbi:phosphatase 2C-like domain-containing protein [Ochromonadaceae sp. CCMP2298]|nr:phosphatase 2C-like domain-containing protein [Ochromonadaceae sp. CCMP2298]